MIEPLPMLLPDPVRAHRTLERCHKKLRRRARPRTQRRFVVERALVLGFGALYLSSIAHDVMRVLIR